MRLFLGGKHVFLHYGESIILKSERSSHCLEAQAIIPLLYPTLSTEMVTSPCPASGGRDVFMSLLCLPCEEDPDNASRAASAVSCLWLWLRNNSVTSVSLRIVLLSSSLCISQSRGSQHQLHQHHAKNLCRHRLPVLKPCFENCPGEIRSPSVLL